MAAEKSSGGRAEIKNIGSVLQIIIPSKTKGFVIIFLFFWLALWLGPLIPAAKMLFHDDTKKISEFMIIWLILWNVTFASLCFLFVWLFAVFAGDEIITLSPTQLRIERKAFRIRKSKEYLLPEAYNFRIGTINGGHLAFDYYGLKTVIFAGGIDKTEAEYILDLFKQKGVKILGTRGEMEGE